MKLQNVLLRLSAGLLLAAPALAQSLDAPSYKAGDKWTYRDRSKKVLNEWSESHQQLVINRVTSTDVLLQR
jgi:hypothetical protein